MSHGWTSGGLTRTWPRGQTYSGGYERTSVDAIRTVIWSCVMQIAGFERKCIQNEQIAANDTITYLRYTDSVSLLNILFFILKVFFFVCLLTGESL